MPPSASTRLRRGALVAAATLALVAGPAPVAGADEPAPAANAAPARLRPSTPQLIQEALSAGHITPAQATLYRAWSLVRPGALPPAFMSETPWDGTLTMLQVQRDVARMDRSRMSPALRAVARIVSTCPGSTGSLPDTKSTRHFFFKYNANKIRGGLTIGQYAASLETVWKTEVGTFGWARPPKDPVNTPPGGRYLVRVVGLGQGLYGYVAGTYYVHNNPATPWNEHDSAASCMVLNQDFREFPSGPIQSLRATTAHEFNHAIQFGYGALTGYGHVKPSFVEGGATWMEDEVFDSSNDNYYYLWPNLTKPMAQFDSPKGPYPYWVMFRALTERYGTGERNGGENVMQFFWEQLSKEASTNLAAMGRALRSEGTTLAKAYHDAAIALRFNLDCSTTPSPWCLEEGPAYEAFKTPNGNTGNVAAIGDAYLGTVANDYALDWIGLPQSLLPFDLTVRVTRGGGRLRASVVCRVGDTLSLLSPAQVAHGTKKATFRNLDPSLCGTVVAVITNERQTKSSPTQITNAKYTLRTVSAI